MIILNFLVCYTMIKCTSKVLTSLLSNKKSKQMLLRSVGRWSPGQLLAPSSWRSLNPPWLGYFFSFQWKITQRDPSARCFYSHQVAKASRDSLMVSQFIWSLSTQAWTLYSSSQNCPRLEFKLSWWPRCKLPHHMKSEKRIQIMWSYSG